MVVDTVHERFSSRGAADRRIAVWLLAVAALVLAMIALGGVTRLTGSGLSMVEWRPATGWLPPLSDSAWQGEFEKYRQFPEYQQVNRGMSLAEFQKIYWFEYSHRLLGRIIGLAFAIPFLVFLAAGSIDRRLMVKLLAVFALGAGQGALGWFMVQSGLVDQPDVSHYRLTAHLGLAVVILGALLWVALRLLYPARRPVASRNLRAAAAAMLILIFLQILSGGLVAGLNAGFTYNTWPLMDGGLMPAEVGRLSPWWYDMLENVGTVQFQHRILAYAALAAGFALWLAVRRGGAGARAGLASDLLLTMLVVQILLGISTLLLVVPVPLAALHQVGAVLVFGLAVVLLHALRTEGSGDVELSAAN